MDDDLSDREFERRHGCSRSDIKKLKEDDLRVANALAFGAFSRRGYITVEQENAAKFLEKKKVCELRDILVQVFFERN